MDLKNAFFFLCVVVPFILGLPSKKREEKTYFNNQYNSKRFAPRLQSEVDYAGSFKANRPKRAVSRVPSGIENTIDRSYDSFISELMKRRRPRKEVGIYKNHDYIYDIEAKRAPLSPSRWEREIYDTDDAIYDSKAKRSPSSPSTREREIYDTDDEIYDTHSSRSANIFLPLGEGNL